LAVVDQVRLLERVVANYAKDGRQLLFANWRGVDAAGARSAGLPRARQPVHSEVTVAGARGQEQRRALTR
jgi:hypothetical protein